MYSNRRSRVQQEPRDSSQGFGNAAAANAADGDSLDSFLTRAASSSRNESKSGAGKYLKLVFCFSVFKPGVSCNNKK
jgi:hypothetical protein